MPLPNRIAALRTSADLARVDVASKMRVSERTVYRWEAGEVAIPDQKKLDLADLFGVSVLWLMGWEGQTNDGDDGERKAAA